jgi:ribonuclease G
MPEADYVGISKKIEQEVERSRLKSLAESIRNEGEGVILRTNAEGESREALEEDLNGLRRIWQGIVQGSRTANAPAELHRDTGLVGRLVRDVMTADTEQLYIDDEKSAGEVRTYLRQTAPALEGRVQLYREQKPLFEKFGIKEQLDRAFQSRVWLPSGGYLVWEQTEALTVIDVNTGKYTGTVDLEETVFQTNREAADEVARLLRLRDVGGIIIIDFIDMEREEHRQQIAQQLESRIRSDRTKCQVVGWTRLGLMELTRKKSRENAMNYFYETCAACKGSGKIYIR